MGSIYGSHPIGLLYFIGTWTLDPHLKWPLFFHVQIQSESQIKRLGSRTSSNDNSPNQEAKWTVGEVFQNVCKFNRIYTQKNRKISQFF